MYYTVFLHVCVYIYEVQYLIQAGLLQTGNLSSGWCLFSVTADKVNTINECVCTDSDDMTFTLYVKQHSYSQFVPALWSTD